MKWRMLLGDALTMLATLPDASVQCIVTSPPYFGLRDYGHDGQIGLEASPLEFTAALVKVFQEARRVLSDDGTLWLNLGDSYAGSWGSQGRPQGDGEMASRSVASARQIAAHPKFDGLTGTRGREMGLKPKDLMGIPWRVAFALQDDGWYLRSDIVWSKPNPMPESVRDRPTKAHEYVFLLSKNPRYWYDADAIREKYSESTLEQIKAGYSKTATKDYDGAGVQNPSSTKARIIESARKKQDGHGNRRYDGFNGRWDDSVERQRKSDAEGVNGRNVQQTNPESERRDTPGSSFNNNPRLRGITQGSNARSVWRIATEPSPYDHFAVMPKALARRCIVAGCPIDGMVLDPFAGVATTGVVAIEEGRSFVGIELNPKYHALARQRLASTSPLLAVEVSA